VTKKGGEANGESRWEDQEVDGQEEGCSVFRHLERQGLHSRGSCDRGYGMVKCEAIRGEGSIT